MRALLSVLVAPPAGALLLAALGWWLGRRYRAFGALLVTLGLTLLVLSSLPVVGSALVLTLERMIEPLDVPALVRAVERGDRDAPQAVVVIGGGVRRNAPDVAPGETVNARTLERLAYGARIARLSGLPMLVSGGKLGAQEHSEAELMAEVLQTAFGLRARWLEENAPTTAGNARESARLLGEAGITRIALVTHAYHMPRAAAVFRASGLRVLPAPTAFSGGWVFDDVVGWIPAASAIQATHMVIHEWAGMLWYRWSGELQ